MEKETEFAAFIGLDWADQKHDLSMAVPGQAQREKIVLEHRPEKLIEWATKLRQRFGGRPIAVALEQSRGALIYALMAYDFLVLFPVTPKTLDRFRSAFTGSGAKDDPTDADYILDILLKHRAKLRAWKPDDVLTRKLARLVEGRRDLIDLRTSYIQRLGSALKEAFPQALDWVGEDLGTVLACDFLLKWSTLQQVKKAMPSTLRKFYYAHNCRRGDLIEKRLQLIAQSQPLTSDLAIIESSSLMILTLVKQLRALLPSIAGYDREIKQLFAQHPDQAIFSSLPGAAEVMAPRLLTAFGTDRERFEMAKNLQQLSGVAPITRRSGKKTIVYRRWACPKFMLQTFHEFARISLKFCPWAKLAYLQFRNIGKGHHAAIRAVAFKWVRIIFRCWKDRVPYDEAKYLQVLRKRGSPYATQVA